MKEILINGISDEDYATATAFTQAEYGWTLKEYLKSEIGSLVVRGQE